MVVAGLGGLGACASTYLACAGIGHITLVDYDHVELSDLNRQILYWERDIGESKPFLSSWKLTELNSSIKITPLFKRITGSNAQDIIKEADVVIDGMDNFETRCAINSACVKEEKPFIHGGTHGLLGEVTTIIPKKTPCFACIFPAISEKKPRTLPAFGTVSSLVASIQVMEAIKLLANFGNLIINKMLYIDIEEMEFRFVDLVKDPECKVCGDEYQGKC